MTLRTPWCRTDQWTHSGKGALKLLHVAESDYEERVQLSGCHNITSQIAPGTSANSMGCFSRKGKHRREYSEIGLYNPETMPCMLGNAETPRMLREDGQGAGESYPLESHSTAQPMLGNHRLTPTNATMIPVSNPGMMACTPSVTARNVVAASVEADTPVVASVGACVVAFTVAFVGASVVVRTGPSVVAFMVAFAGASVVTCAIELVGASVVTTVVALMAGASVVLSAIANDQDDIKANKQQSGVRDIDISAYPCKDPPRSWMSGKNHQWLELISLE